MRHDLIHQSIPAMVRTQAVVHAEREALVDGDVRLTYAQLGEAMTDSGRAAIAAGLQPGDRAAVWAPNSAEWVVGALGILAAGGVLVPLNTRFKGAEAAYVLRASGASMLLCVGEFLGVDYPAILRAADPDLAALERLVVSAPSPGATTSPPGSRSTSRTSPRGSTRSPATTCRT